MNKKDQIKLTISESIETFFLNKEVETTHPLDLIFPKEFTFVWDEIKPIKEKNKLSFTAALEKYLKANCLDFYNK